MHQPFDGATGDHEALPHHLPPYLPHAVDRKVLREHASDLGRDDQILTRPCRQTRWILSLRDVLVVGGWGDRQDTVDRLDPIGIAMIVNESNHLRNGRRAPPARIMPTPPRQAQDGLKQNLVGLPQLADLSFQRLHLVSDLGLLEPFTQHLGTQPIFSAIDTMVAHLDG